jgi:exodeoxyribonuclease VII large subunit
MGFNEEIVVRAVAASRIPIISAVGHETDWTLIDLVADARAPTPTKAAEWVVPKLAELAEGTEKLASRLKASARRHLTVARRDFSSMARALPRLDDLLALPRQRFDACEKRLPRALLANTRAHHTRYVRLSARLRPGAIRQRVFVCGREIEGLRARAAQALANRVTARRHRLDALSQMLASLSYQSVLQRGFALVRDSEGAMVRAAEALSAGDRVEIEFRDGRVEAETKSVRLKTEPDKPTPAKPKPNPAVRPRRSGGSGQGTLF